MNDRLNDLVNQHYGESGLMERILSALEESGINLKDAVSRDFSPVAEFHIGGRAATVKLANFAKLQSHHRVLDLGSGLGGPARTLAEEFGVRVDGVDLTREFCDVANELTRISGLSDRVTFFCGDALSMNLADHTYDVVWTQQSCMNIRDKECLIREVNRVLKPGGTYVFQEVFGGDHGDVIHLPVPWARSAEMSFLSPPSSIHDLISGEGMKELVWLDATDQFIEEYRELAAKTGDVTQRPSLGVHLMLGEQSATMRQNVVRNLEEGRVSVYQGVFVKP
jgi:MPBQ/MSBQ methyltransferase